MSTMSYALTDSMTMLRRQIRHMGRYASLTLMVIGIPVVFLLLFVYVFGGTLGDGLGGITGGRAAYLAYVVPGVLMMAVAGSAQGTSLKVAMDMDEGIIDRFRTMAISRVSVLTGHVLASMIQILLAITVVLGIAAAIGYRTGAGVADWFGLLGVFLLISFAITWLTVAAGITAKSPETASNTPMPLMLLPFMGSGFVPTESMPTAMQWFAEYQPFTPWIEVTRGLLDGTGAAGSDIALAVSWAGAIALFGYLVARAEFDRRGA
ncbi:ABC transporter permease [Glycomyces sp. L485]|uniref:ABC transporter permease n=1 Tax=Glycomyces sp. L485 TaxID=2909235 RepID=UPI001F4A3E14|nr:ABC transporter permease [Glycomyces sp. L485]MCH7232051.1 ABC transporter permease [Glycomyces sp. L485]